MVAKGKVIEYNVTSQKVTKNYLFFVKNMLLLSQDNTQMVKEVYYHD